jgi:mono/diheme cytochrome c family protein
MIPTHRTLSVLGAALTSLCLSVAVDVVKVATQAPEDSEGWHIPAAAATERNPEPINPAVLARGQSLYKAKCQRCHGADGAGHGPEADPNHPAGDLSNARRASLNPDGVLFYKIWNGRAKPKMPAMKTDISQGDVWTVIHYVKTLRK